MQKKKRIHPKEKSSLHPRNKHKQRYVFKKLIKSCPELAPFVKINKYNDESIDFFNPQAVKMLNTALLKQYYHIDFWDIPKGYLCPPIPGRADYIHHIADLFWNNNLTKKQLNCLDIGVGANCIYPIIGSREYQWTFVGTDIDPIALASAKKIITKNFDLNKFIELRLQTNPKNIFKKIIKKDEFFDITICNPPFHKSLEESLAGTKRKLKNLKGKKSVTPILNFGGQNNELRYKGGEEMFIQNMIYESKQFADSCFWFTTLVSKQSHLKKVYKLLKKVDVVQVKTIPMGQGNKISRIVAWTFLNPEQQKEWNSKLN